MSNSLFFAGRIFPLLAGLWPSWQSIPCPLCKNLRRFWWRVFWLLFSVTGILTSPMLVLALLILRIDDHSKVHLLVFCWQHDLVTGKEIKLPICLKKLLQFIRSTHSLSIHFMLFEVTWHDWSTWYFKSRPVVVSWCKTWCLKKQKPLVTYC